MRASEVPTASPAAATGAAPTVESSDSSAAWISVPTLSSA